MGKDRVSDYQAEVDGLPFLQVGAKDSTSEDSGHDPFTEKPHIYEVSNELIEHLSQVLYPYVRGLVYHSNVACWKGQENDLVKDLCQTALLKIITYLEHARRYMIPIYALEQLSRVIAKRCFLDLMRREKRLQHFGDENNALGGSELWADPAQQAEEHIYEEELLVKSARIIATFPPKLRKAILSDLARHSSFTQTPTILQRALLEIGIDLREYTRQPSGKAERGSQTALRSLAYKRLAQEIQQQETGKAEADAACIQENAELTSLAHHLQQTRQLVPESAFQKRLFMQLMAKQFQPVGELISSLEFTRHALSSDAQTFLSTTESGNEGDVTSLCTQRELVEIAVGSTYQLVPVECSSKEAYAWAGDAPDQRPPAAHGEPDIPTIVANPVLERLARLLYVASTPIPIDPAFKETLRQKLLAQLREWPGEARES